MKRERIQFVPDTICSRYNLFPIQYVPDTICSRYNLCRYNLCRYKLCRYNLCRYNLYMNQIPESTSRGGHRVGSTSDSDRKRTLKSGKRLFLCSDKEKSNTIFKVLSLRCFSFFTACSFPIKAI
jgi:hypothetical protein